MTTHTEPARLADKPEDYARFNLEKGRVQQWEDGIRLDPGAPNLEWWYLDADLADGTGLAVLFCTKDGTRPTSRSHRRSRSTSPCPMARGR